MPITFYPRRYCLFGWSLFKQEFSTYLSRLVASLKIRRYDLDRWMLFWLPERMQHLDAQYPIVRFTDNTVGQLLE